MTGIKGLKYVPGAVVAALSMGMAINGCSAVAEKGCDGLDATVSAQATIKQFNDAAVKLNARAADVENKFRDVCNAMNGDMGLDTSKTTATDACGILKARVDQALANHATVDAEVVFNCTADVRAQATCEADCNAKLNCDATAMCEPGKLVVACMGTCDAQCDVTAPDFQCSGSCQGSCTSDLAVTCSGSCEGSCDAPMWTGTCDVGCTAGFDGSCGGMCNGMCDGMSSTGTCKGKCVGSCSAQATGACTAQCMGKFSGGSCTGMCKGSCTTTGSAMCNGSCSGTCTFTQPMATCTGECHGSCTANASPPRCTGMISCKGAAECHGSCDANAKADVVCSKPVATVTVVGDAELQQALSAHIDDWAVAFNMLTALQGPLVELGGRSIDTFTALGDVGISGAACVGSAVSAVGEANAHISVSVTASASFSTNKGMM